MAPFGIPPPKLPSQFAVIPQSARHASSEHTMHSSLALKSMSPAEYFIVQSLEHFCPSVPGTSAHSETQLWNFAHSGLLSHAVTASLQASFAHWLCWHV